MECGFHFVASKPFCSDFKICALILFRSMLNYLQLKFHYKEVSIVHEGEKFVANMGIKIVINAPTGSRN
jgi:hypothetical protein